MKFIEFTTQEDLPVSINPAGIHSFEAVDNKLTAIGLLIGRTIIVKCPYSEVRKAVTEAKRGYTEIVYGLDGKPIEIATKD